MIGTVPVRGVLAFAAMTLGGCAAMEGALPSTTGPAQVALGSRHKPVITVDGLRFRDLDEDGGLSAFEDWKIISPLFKARLRPASAVSCLPIRSCGRRSMASRWNLSAQVSANG